MSQFPALIFAAGFGTRMGALTQTRPKPLVKVGGIPLIDRALPLLQAADCSPIVANLHYKAEMLEQHLKPKGVLTNVESPNILETGGGLRDALGLLGETTVVTLNPDALWHGPNPVQLLLDSWEPDDMDALLMTVPVDRAVGHGGKGDFARSDEGILSRGPGVVYGGVQIIRTDLLKLVPQASFSLNVVWDMMLEQKRMHGLVYPGLWCDVGHPEGIVQAEKMLAGADV